MCDHRNSTPVLQLITVSLEADEIDADELQAYLARQMESVRGNHDAVSQLLRKKTELRRAIRIYDYVRYHER